MKVSYENDIERPDIFIENEEGMLSDLSTRMDLIHDLNREKVGRALRKAGANGATTQEISNITGLGIQTARKYLEELCATREAYRLKRNRTTTIYYNNGKPRHDFGVRKIEEGNTVFEISLAEGPEDSLLLHIIEKKFTLLEGEQNEGGVIVPINQIPALIEKIQEMYKLAGEGNGPRQ